ncbi:MAG: extracellular solute-binding protein [Chloroflexota bacterium]
MNILPPYPLRFLLLLFFLTLSGVACVNVSQVDPSTEYISDFVPFEVTPDSGQPEIRLNSTQAFPPGTELRILQWEHFVPAYDIWFDEFARTWGEQVGVEVTVDHIDISEVPDVLAAELAAGAGHTLVETLFPPSAFIEGLHDLTELNQEAIELFGPQVKTCKANSYLPTIDSYYAFCHGYVPDPGNYNTELWGAVGYPDGPTTYAELLAGGEAIYERFDIPVGLGLSPELDSEMANRAVIWSFGGAIQDINENVVLNSPETVAAVAYMADLYQKSMTDDVYSWDPFTNNQRFINGEVSYILNSISAYRTLQELDGDEAQKIGFVQALDGPAGAYASSHTWQIYAVPKYTTEAEFEAAKAFMLHLTINYNQAVFHSRFYNFPAFPTTSPQLFAEDGWLADDPFGSQPADKLQVLANAEEWGVHLGYPGVANPAIGEVFTKNIVTEMVARVTRGEMTAEASVAQAEREVDSIFDKWREKGLVGGNPLP